MRFIKSFIKKLYLNRIEPRLFAQPVIVRTMNRALYCTEQGVSDYTPNETNIIVSLTTYQKRIFDVCLVIESLMEQTLKPNKIVLWLSKDEFNDDNIPLVLKKQRERGLEIGYCQDVRSYTKLIPALQKYPNDLIITVDDDGIYPYDLVENLYNSYKLDKNCVHFCRGYRMQFNRKGCLRTYKKWPTNPPECERSFLAFPLGSGGVLYPPHCFHTDILREELFLQLSPTADDVWFKAMTLLNDVPCKKIAYDVRLVGLFNNQDIALETQNVHNRKNDVQIKQVFDYYSLWDKLRKE
ncbi:MAG: hypothetical protein LBS16_07755 [Prevotellaceae bacterium]|jgi:hypothetical protein|nr:hypothetical protein [Prevotellaceae bacterium]